MSVGRRFWDPGQELEAGRDFFEPSTCLSLYFLCIFPLVPMFLPGICLLPRLHPLTPSARKELATSTRSAPQSSAPAGGPSVNSCTCCNVPAVGTCACSQSAPTPRGAAVSKISTSKAQHKSNTFLGREGMSVSDES